MQKTNNFIIEDEFDIVDIGTLHNKKRLLIIATNMIKNPGKSILSQSSSRTEAKAAYQFFNNENLDFEEISRVHHFKTIERIVEVDSPILAIQDTTIINYSSQQKKDDCSKTNQHGKGLKLHSCIATTLDGLNLGILHQLSLSDDSSEVAELSDYEKKNRPIEEKQSYRWIESFNESMFLMPDDIDITFVSDREGDIYEYMSTIDSRKKSFITRIVQNRMTSDNERILDAIKKEKTENSIIIRVPRNPLKKKKARDAELEIRFAKYEIKCPDRLKNNEKYSKPIAISVVYVKEKNPPEGDEVIEWFLMTNKVVSDFASALQIIKNYIQRWKIERFHFVLKSGGCEVQKIQARTMKVTISMIMLYSIISVFIMNLTYAARLTPDRPCSDFFEENEWKILYCIANQTNNIPDKPYAIKDAVNYIAWLGAGKRPPSDGDPGLKLIWRGLEKLYLLVDHCEVIHGYVEAIKINGTS